MPEELPENIEQKRRQFSEADNKAIVDRFLADRNMSKDELDHRFKAVENTVRRIDPTTEYMTLNDIPYRDQAIEQSAWADLKAGLANSFVDLAQGVANIAPTAMTFAGAGKTSGTAKKFLDGWIDGVDGWMQEQKMRQSDKANEGLAADFSNVNAWGAAVGQGIGFIAQIFGTAGLGGAVAKGAAAGSRLGRLSKVIGAGNQALGGQRAGSFIAGTFNMYPGIYREAKHSGLSSEAAARFSLTVASLVSATEGAALEWVGKSLTRPVTNKLAQQSVKESIKEASKALGKGKLKNMSMADLQVVSATAGKKFATKLKAYVPKMTESAAIEFGQEFGQTYIEQGAKNIYDVTWGEKKGGQGHFGVEVFGKDKTRTFREALAGGMVGGLIGGGLGLGGSSIRGVKGETLGLAVESAQGNAGKIKDIHNTIDAMSAKGEIEPGSAKGLHARVDEMNEFYGKIKGMGLDSPTAKYQMYQMINLQDKYNEKFDEEIAVTDDMNEVVAQTYRKNNGFADTITKSLNSEIAEITEKKSPATWNKGKFEQKLDKYNALYDDVLNNRIETEEDLNKALGRINKNFKTATETAGDTKQKFGKTYMKDGVKITGKALDNMDEIRDLRNKASKAKEGEERDAVWAEIQEKFGIDKKAVNFLYKNKSLTAEDLQEVEAMDADADVSDAEEMASYSVATVEKAKEEGKIDEIEESLIKSIKNAQEMGEQKLADEYIEELEDYRQKRLERKKKDELRLKDKDRTLELYKEYYQDEDRGVLETELASLMALQTRDKTDKALKLRKINFINNILNDRIISDKRKDFVGDPSQLTYIQKMFSQELDDQIEDFYIAPDQFPTLYLKELADDIYELYNDIKGDKDFFVTKDLRKKKRLILAEISKVLDDVENEVGKRLGEDITAEEQAIIDKRKEATKETKDEQEKQSEEKSKAELKRKSDSKIEREQSKTTVNEDTGELELNLKVKQEEKQPKSKKVTPKKKLKEIIPQGIEVGNFVVDVIGTAFQRIRVFSKRTGRLASRKKTDEILSEFSMNDDNLTGVVSSLNNTELAQADKLANDYSVSRIDMVDEVDVDDSLDQAIFETMRGKTGTKLQRTGETKEASKSWISKDGVAADEVAMSVMQSPQFENMDEADVIEAIYNFVNEYENIRDYEDRRPDLASDITSGNISENFKDITGLPLTEENIATVSSKIENVMEQRAREEAQEQEEAKLGVQGTEEMQQEELAFDDTAEETTEETPKVESQEEQEIAGMVEEEVEEELDEETQATKDANVEFEKNRNSIADQYDPDFDEGRHQRSDNIDSELLVQDNLELYEKIKAHFKKIFPFISVKEIDNIGRKYGAQILARVVESGIEIDTGKAMQTSLIHEYAHIFVEVLGRNHPIIKLGMKTMIGTQGDLDAQRLYPLGSTQVIDGKKVKITREDQLEEALMEAVAIDTLEKLKTRFEGSAYVKMVAFLKRLWKTIKKKFTKNKSKDIVGIISDTLILKNRTYTINQGALKGIVKNQLQDKVVNPANSKTVEIVSNTLIKQRLEAIGKKEAFNTKNKPMIYRSAIQAMIQRYFKEKSELPTPYDVNVFENVDLDLETANNIVKDINVNTLKDLKEQSLAVIESAKGDNKFIFYNEQKSMFGDTITKDDKDGQRVRGKEYYKIGIVGDFYQSKAIMDQTGKDNADIIFVASKKEAQQQYDNYKKGGATSISGIKFNKDNEARVEYVPNDAYNIKDKAEFNSKVKSLSSEDIRNFARKLRTQLPEVFTHVDRVVNSMFKTNIEIDEIEDVENINLEGEYGKQVDDSVKRSKKLNPSVTSIISSIVDEDGYKIDKDIIYQYVGHVAQTTRLRQGFIDKLVEDAKNKNVVAKRLLSVINSLEPGDRAGTLKTLSSLKQKKYIGLNTTVATELNEYEEEEVTDVKVSIRTVNKDHSMGGKLDVIKNTFDKIKNGVLKSRNRKKFKDGWRAYFGRFRGQEHSMLLERDPAYLKGVAQLLAKATGLDINLSNINQIMDSFGGPSKFYKAMAGFEYHSFGTYFSQEGGQGETTWENINGWIGRLVGFFEDKSKLVNSFLNSEGNTMNTTEMGDWMDDQNALILLDKDYQQQMLDSPVFKDNPILKKFIEDGVIESATLDSVKNIFTNKNIEYKNISDNDFLVSKFLMFAANASNNYYDQSIGVKSNRTNVTYVQSPRYTNDKLKEEYDTQVNTLQKMYDKMVGALKEKTIKGKVVSVEKQINDIQSDFKKLYVHDITPEGKIISGYMAKNHTAAIQKIGGLIVNTKLTKAFSDKKIGKDKPYSSLQDMVENFYYTEALNRAYLGDIYAGPALYYAGLVAGNDAKKGAQQAVKRLSGVDSNGETNEIEQDVYYLFHDGSISDSFEMNGTHYTKLMQEDAGNFEKVKLVGKGQVHQVDPTTGKAFYSKRSEYNLQRTEDGHNLDSFGETYKEMGNAMMKLEDFMESKLGRPVNLVMADRDTMKGTFDDYTTHNIYEVLDKVLNGEETDLSDIANSLSKVKIRSQRTLKQADKALDSPHEQVATFGSRGAVLQLDYASEKQRTKYKDLAVSTLMNELVEGGKNNPNNILSKLKAFSKSLNALGADMNDRDRSATTELIEDMIAHNSKEGNENNQITVFDEPSLRLVYEQFIASKLTKKGIRIQMPGMFAHQAPDMDGKRIAEVQKKLADNEIAVPWKFIWDKKPSDKIMNDFLKSNNNKIAVERIPTSSPVSMYAGKIAFFLDTESATAIASDFFVKVSDSDHDGDMMMIYRKEINEKGRFMNSSMTNLFDIFHENMLNEDFLDEQKGSDLNFEKALADSLEELGLTDKEVFSVSGIDNEVKVAGKMKFGQYAVGRFAIAGKIMSLMSQSKEKLNKPLRVMRRDGKVIELEFFSNKGIEDNAIFLQAALDIGNNPILTATGFNMTTIDIGTALMQLEDKNGERFDRTDIIEFLNRPAIVEASRKFENTNSNYDNRETQSLQKYLGKYKSETVDGKTRSLSNEKIVDKFGMDILDLININKISTGLSELITYIQLDKNLPNNAEKTRTLIDNIYDFHELPFSVDTLTEDKLYQYRQQVLESQNAIYKANLLTANFQVNEIMDMAGRALGNKFQLRKNAKEQLMQSVAQNQLSEQREDVAEFIYDLSAKMRVIQNVAYLDDTTVNARKEVKAIAKLEGKAKQDRIAERRAKHPKRFANIEADLKAYEDNLLLVKEAARFKDNSVFQHLQFDDVEIGRGKKKVTKSLMKLNKNFKSTEESRELFKKDFLALQKLDPQLAQEIIDYQLYRWGTNNKIGSFIDGLPTDIKIKALVDSSRINNEAISVDFQKELRRNLILANKDLAKEVGNLKKYKGDFVTLKGELYETQLDEQTISDLKSRKIEYKHIKGPVYEKFDMGTFQSNKSFTAYENKNKEKPVATEETVEEMIESCKIKTT
jgi:hypothetical protein